MLLIHLVFILNSVISLSSSSCIPHYLLIFRFWNTFLGTNFNFLRIPSSQHSTWPVRGKKLILLPYRWYGLKIIWKNASQRSCLGLESGAFLDYKCCMMSQVNFAKIHILPKELENVIDGHWYKTSPLIGVFTYSFLLSFPFLCSKIRLKSSLNTI